MGRREDGQALEQRHQGRGPEGMSEERRGRCNQRPGPGPARTQVLCGQEGVAVGLSRKVTRPDLPLKGHSATELRT